ncbi:MAG: AraC family transcriptional regulator [Clostridia bacterium]|nr:AraC family transcriptional regulator [Clostridia bacterium]
MNQNDLANKLGLLPVNNIEDKKDVTGCYVGDLLSFVMGRANPGDLWITVMNNINIVAVGVMADVSCIVLCEDVNADDDVIQRATEKGIMIYKSPLTAFELSKEIGKYI